MCGDDPWLGQAADRDGGRRSDGLTSEEQEELRRLRRENRQLRQERDPGKGRGLVRSERRDVVSIYNLMTANRAMFSISTMSRTLGVSRAGYYAWLDREPSVRSQPDAELTDRIAAIHKASRETYGLRASTPSSSTKASVSAASGSSG